MPHSRNPKLRKRMQPGPGPVKLHGHDPGKNQQHEQRQRQIEFPAPRHPQPPRRQRLQQRLVLRIELAALRSPRSLPVLAPVALSAAACASRILQIAPGYRVAHQQRDQRETQEKRDQPAVLRSRAAARKTSTSSISVITPKRDRHHFQVQPQLRLGLLFLPAALPRSSAAFRRAHGRAWHIGHSGLLIGNLYRKTSPRVTRPAMIVCVAPGSP